MKPSLQKVQNPEQVRADMRKMRELLRMNQDEFSELIGLSRNTLHDYENGKQEWGQERANKAIRNIREHLESTHARQWTTFLNLKNRDLPCL